jgi:hypothetical protein
MRLHLAGMEKKEDIIKDLPCKFVLISFLYAQENNLDWLDQYEVLCDSGAASIMSAYDVEHTAIKQKGSELVKKKVGDLDLFFEKYKKFIERNLHRFTAFVELDLQPIVGVEKVLEWRRQLTEIVGNERLVVVYHGAADEDFEQICRDYRYIGFGGGVAARTEQFTRLFQIAEKHKTKVHGFALTQGELMRRYPFYSVDSTSWMSGSRYGITYYFKGAKLVQTNDKAIRRTMGKELANYGIDHKAVMADNANEVDKMNALAWIKYAEHVDKHSKKYWDDEPKALAVIGEPSPEATGDTEETAEYIDSLEEAASLDAAYEAKVEAKKKKYNNQADNWGDGGTVGNIMKLRQDPSFEAKRIAKHKEAMSMNTFNWKHGKFSKYHATPEYVHKYLDEIDNIDLDNPDEIKNVLLALLQANLKRITLQQFFELADGGVQDKALTNLMKDTIGQLGELYNTKVSPAVPGTVNATQINIGDISRLTEEDRLSARSILRAAIEQSRTKNQDESS